MKNCLYYLILITTACFIGGDLQAADKNKMIQDLDNIKSTFEVKYAPFEWKKNYTGWELEEQINLAKAQIQSSGDLTAKDYHRILHSFFRSTKDWHVQDFYYSLEYAFIPIDIDAIGNKYYVTDIWYDSEFLSFLKQRGLYISDDFIAPGDEIVAFNEKPIQEVVEEILAKDFGGDTSLTARALAAGRLTNTMAQLGESVQQGWASIAYRHPNQIEVKHASIAWIYIPDSITNKTIGGMHQISSKETKKSFLKRKMYSPLYAAKKKSRSDSMTKVLKAKYPDFFNNYDDYDDENDDEDSRVLELGSPIWSIESSFKAYIYLSPVTNKKIGYIRLPTYSLDTEDPSADMMALHNKSVIELAEILRYFQKETDALVIDQVDNGGGYLFYMYGILSLLSEKPLEVPPERLTITQEDVFQAVTGDVDDMPQEEGYVLGYYADGDFYNCLKRFSKFIISQWDAGKTLTDPCYVLGLQTIKPHPKVHYTKPILVLIDKMDFSCADFFPAILQDNKRALLFGENTAGAGGAVEMHAYPNLLGVMAFSYTASYAVRSNGQPIENLGVTPDIPYEVTVEDILQGYKGYADAVNNAVEGLLKRN